MFILSEQSTIANHFLTELRDIAIQKDPLRFRRNLERIGEIMAYEISKTLPYVREEVVTPLGTSKTFLLAHQPVLAAILRASLPFHQGFLNMFDQAQNAFIGAYRGPHAEGEDFSIQLEYISCPDLTSKTLIIIDPMLATGRSLETSYRALIRYGIPARTHIVAAIAAPEGVEYLQKRMPECRIWVGALDECLNHNYYIIPGLGDAGDLAFGEKL
ncbi:MAG: uracil phosphoribosyltransferase [Siphonobacter sp.]